MSLTCFLHPLSSSHSWGVCSYSLAVEHIPQLPVCTQTNASRRKLLLNACWSSLLATKKTSASLQFVRNSANSSPNSFLIFSASSSCSLRSRFCCLDAASSHFLQNSECHHRHNDRQTTIVLSLAQPFDHDDDFSTCPSPRKLPFSSSQQSAGWTVISSPPSRSGPKEWLLQKRTTLCKLNRCSSTDRIWHRLMILLKTSRLFLLESDLDGDQIRNMLASLLQLQERQANADQSRVYHSLRENLVSSSSHFRESTERPAARKVRGNPLRCFQTEGSRVKKHFPTEDFSSDQQVPGNNEPPLWFSNPESSVKSFLQEPQDYMLAEAKSEVRKQECRADSLDSSVRDLQRQRDSNRLETYCTNQGFEESRKEQARLHQASAQWKRAVRDTRIRSIHEVGQLKRAQQMRIDEDELRESHAAIQKRQSFQVLELWRTATKASDLIHGICLRHRETSLAIHAQQSIHHRHLIKEFFTLGINVLQVGNPCGTVQGDLLRKVKNEIERLFQRRDFRGHHQPWILSSRRSTELSTKTANVGASLW